MNHKYFSQLEQLRQQIPIGIRHGLDILDRVGGDIEKAKALFISDMTVILMDKADVSDEVAKKHLVKINMI